MKDKVMKNKKYFKTRGSILIILLVLTALSLTACTPKAVDNNEVGAISPTVTTEAKYMKITPAEAKKQLESDKSIILVDVRTEAEYKEGHIKGSVLIPYDLIGKEASSKLSDKSAKIIVYCRSGNRSEVAARELLKMGYTSVYDLGGIQDWPYEVVK